MIVKVEIGMVWLDDIVEKACGVYRKDLAKADYPSDIKHIFECLSHVMRLWGVVEDNFDYDDELLLTLERREVKDDE